VATVQTCVVDGKTMERSLPLYRNVQYVMNVFLSKVKAKKGDHVKGPSVWETWLMKH